MKHPVSIFHFTDELLSLLRCRQSSGLATVHLRLAASLVKSLKSPPVSSSASPVLHLSPSGELKSHYLIRSLGGDFSIKGKYYSNPGKVIPSTMS